VEEIVGGEIEGIVFGSRRGLSLVFVSFARWI
jgi:hypothetical protein